MNTVLTTLGALKTWTDSVQSDVLRVEESAGGGVVEIPVELVKSLIIQALQMDRDEDAFSKENESLDNESLLTTQQAADLLQISRPHFVSLLEKGELDFIRYGKHRRVRKSDLDAYMERVRIRRSHLLESMTVEAQRLGLGYGKEEATKGGK